MCKICDRATEDLEDLRGKYRDLNQKYRDTRPVSPLLGKAVSELRSQVRRAENDLPRLRWSIHGGPPPSPPKRRRKKPDPLQLQLPLD